jgi:cysteine desulfurase
MARFVYADNAATTAVSKTVLDEMIPYFTDKYGNPSSIYSIGRESREAVDTARKQVADALGATEQEIFFTSGGSEADNWAIRGIAQANAKKGKHLITTKFEHHAVLHTMKALEKEGFEVTYLDVNENGVVKPADLAAAIRPDTTLVTIMYANNEIGTIQPIPELGKICADRGVVFHTDAVQAVGHVKIDVKEQQISLLSLSAHKFHGPKGVGALYIKKGLRFPNLIEGGAQEKNRRAGTENVAGIVGLGKAITLACASIEENTAKVSALRDRLIDGILKLPRTRLNGDRVHRLPGNVNISIEGIEGESLLLLLDMNGVCASSGSACTSGSLDPSHVLLAIGLKHEIAHGSLRLSICEQNTDEDIDYILEVLPKIVERLREMSPVWDAIQKNS